MKKYLIIWLLGCAIPLLLPAQDFSDQAETLEQEETATPVRARSEARVDENVRVKKLDRAAWQRATEGLDYSSGKEKQKKEPEGKGKGSDEWGGGGKPRRSGGLFSPGFDFFSSNAGIAVLKVLVIIIAIVALFFLIRSLMGLSGPRNRKLKTEQLLGLSLEQIEDRFQELDLDGYIRQAIEQGDYPLAVRLYYLAALKALSARELIQWKKDKTNLSYLSELRGSSLLPAFQEITYIFEWVWYGQSNISSEAFDRIQPKMRSFLEQVEQAAQPAGVPA